MKTKITTKLEDEEAISDFSKLNTIAKVPLKAQTLMIDAKSTIDTLMQHKRLLMETLQYIVRTSNKSWIEHIVKETFQEINENYE